MPALPRAFSPIAIVGRSCVLPGALSPAELWAAVSEGRDLLSKVPDGRWKIDAAETLCTANAPDLDRAWSDRGGYVRGFESLWDARGFAIASADLDDVSPLAAWTLHCARAARNECLTRPEQRIGAVFGNLGFPSEAMAEFARDVWRDGATSLDPKHRYMSAGTADLLQRALALNAGSHCIDAACASSLYAIKLACDRLHEGSADLMLAGAVQAADDLFLHVGFCALSALSRSGQSRPFHTDADGLVPAEGAAFVALKRLSDARRDGDVIHGIIRGIGLSNDGRGKGLLAPSVGGQTRAMRAAYTAAGLEPNAVGLLECHATGTPVGDATELASSAQVFANANELPIGSLKSNLGHLITTAGAAGLIKLLEAMRAGKRPPTLHASPSTPALHGSPFRLLHTLEPWPSDQPRIAAISAFGFGGNNAHLIVSEDDQTLDDGSPPQSRAQIAIVGIGALVASASNRDAFAAALLAGESLLNGAGEGQMAHIDLAVDGLRFPPRDMLQTLPQQLAILQTSREAMTGVTLPIGERIGAFIGMEPDPEVARYGARWRLPDARRIARDAIVPALESAAVLGCMPNIPANRLSSLFDFGGPAFTVQSGATSGIDALRIASGALRRGELDAALVGAVDLSCEAVQRFASADKPGDAAISLVLKRYDDALRDGDQVFACVEAEAVEIDANASELGDSEGAINLNQRLGNAFAASGLTHVAAAALLLNQRCDARGVPQLDAAAPPIDVVMRASSRLRLSVPPAPNKGPPSLLGLTQRLRCYSGVDKAAVARALQDDQQSLDGPARLVMVVDDARFEAQRAKALAHLQRGMPAGNGVHFCERPIGGEIAFAFAGAGASYHGMGRALLQHLPELRDRLAIRSTRLPHALQWAIAEAPTQPTALQQLWGASALSQLHLELTQGMLGIQADAWLGYSSGETNALVASGTWTDPDALMTEMEASGLVTHELGGPFAAIERAWGQPVQWSSWTVLAPINDVRTAIDRLPDGVRSHVHIAIINSDENCLIAGDEAGCARVVEQLGTSRCLRLEYPLAVHVPELAAVSDAWLQLHRRAVSQPSGRVYSNAFGRAYDVDTESCAQAILQQADRLLDLRPAVLAAWNDGVRVFIEHGPNGAYGRAIRSILGTREALVVSLDRKGSDRKGLDQKAPGIESTLGAIAALLAAGVPMQHERFTCLDLQTSAANTRRFPAHPPAIIWPHPKAQGASIQIMLPAPTLPSVSAPVATSPRAIEVKQPLAPTRLPQRHAAHPLPATRNEARTHALASQFQQQIAQLAQVQQRFVEQQSDVHRRYLTLQQRALHMLLGHADAAPTPSPHANAQALPIVLTPACIPTVHTAESARSPRVAPRSDLRASGKAISGPSFSREQLEVHASGRIADLFGSAFDHHDAYHRQVRMPMPPLLLADRVVGLDAKIDSMGTGTIWTETHVQHDSWYLHHGHMPAGILIEAGQADLMLISWLGVDRFNRSERVYRLLGCELTYHGDLPTAGESVQFEIVLDSHAAQGDVRLMFFHYDCVNLNQDGRLQLSVRKGQAGFFSDAELAESAGCLWSPEQQAIVEQPVLDPPSVARVPSALTGKQLLALSKGDAFACFGEGFEFAQTHTRTPSIQSGRMLLLDRVTELSADGGPWQRGYLRAELDIDPAQWFFDGHFKNDPCMPGTLMFEGCLQAMAVYLLAHGFGLQRDGWRFQPVPELPYQLQCRGQVTPHSRLLVTEVFVEEISAGPTPTLYADLLCTVDGLKAFHARRVALQLVPDWPLSAMPELLAVADSDALPCAEVDGFRFDQTSLLACAIGRPSQAFGPIYQRFDSTQRVARLPSPPYLFMSRIREIDGPIGVMRAGARVVTEYDIPTDAWYFDSNGCRSMPFAVLLEAALQPCGWLSSYVGSALTESDELGFRNLDGEGELLAELFANSGTLTTEVTLTDVSATAGMIIESFSVTGRIGDREVYRLKTVFGFFPPAALANQAGLRTDESHRELLTRNSSDVIDLAAPNTLDATRPRLANGNLLMLDRIEGHWPNAGANGLGQLRAVKDIDPSAWFFKAHFFQDPVQPGSLGLEAMLQALQFHMLSVQMDNGIPNPRFEPIALTRAHRWKYRGQVLPKHRQMHTTLEITESGIDDRGAYALADASLWADGQRIYEMLGVGMRIVSGGAERAS